MSGNRIRISTGVLRDGCLSAFKEFTLREVAWRAMAGRRWQRGLEQGPTVARRTFHVEYSPQLAARAKADRPVDRQEGYWKQWLQLIGNNAT